MADEGTHVQPLNAFRHVAWPSSYSPLQPFSSQARGCPQGTTVEVVVVLKVVRVKDDMDVVVVSSKSMGSTSEPRGS